MDWYLCSDSTTLVCAVLNDASRMIISDNEFSATTALEFHKYPTETYEEYRHISPIWEVITDYGTQFYVNK